VRSYALVFRQGRPSAPLSAPRPADPGRRPHVRPQTAERALVGRGRATRRPRPVRGHFGPSGGRRRPPYPIRVRWLMVAKRSREPVCHRPERERDCPLRLGLAALKRCAAAAYQGSFSNVVDRFTLVPVFRFACDDIKFLPVLMVGPVSGFQEVSARIRSMHKSKVAPPGAAC
jgi:hypothetical protein